ncbi:hypothetical protein AMTR_s00019p00228390 [Amborella trichopoda]|uniref:Protein kinase domain-containing protein n=1 Tax=Amborella trichopoda TaxID=13333 RepID=W1PBP6_AMBTC|nr:hypothetical protein AMTR_s00019p00228390 [Amborella trichopoda]
MRALEYEFMEKGSLDGLLFRNTERISFDMLHEIALGTAKGIGFWFGEALQYGCNRCHHDNGEGRGRGTPDYAAPERWMPFPVTHKCDVYSYGMLLFEIVGRRRNLELNLESQEKFLKWVQEKFEEKEIDEIVKICEWVQEKFEKKDIDEIVKICEI